VASLPFPDTGTRMVVYPTGKPAVDAVGYLSADEDLTAPAEVYYDVDGVKGGLIPLDSDGRRPITLDGYGEQPDYWGPVAGTRRLWLTVNGVTSPVDADYKAQIEAISSAVIDNSAIAAADATTKADAAQAFARQRVNHTGTQTADTLTDGTTNKAFLATERTKLTGVATGATANSTDAQLRDRTMHTGSQAQSTVSGLVSALAAKAPADGVYVATDPQWGYVSGSDLTAACQAAIAAMPTSGSNVGGQLVIPAGSWTFSTRVTLKSGVRVTGAGRQASRITASTNGVFTWTADLTNVVVEHLGLTSGSGHLFAPSGGGADWGIFTVKVQNCDLTQLDVNSSIMRHVSGRDYDNVDFEQCYFTRTAGALVPGFYIVNSAGAANENRWRDCWAHSNNCTTTPMFWLESTSIENYVYDNVFENITGEQNAGGIIDARGAHNLIVSNVADYDTTVAYTSSVIRVGKSATGGLRSLSPLISSSGRRDNTTLPGGIYDINLVPGEVFRGTVINPNHSSATLKLNFSSDDQITVLNAAAGAWAGQPTNVKNYFGAQAQFGSGLYIGTAQVAAGPGSPEGVVTGSVGDEYTRTDGGNEATKYVKESGSATTTGWVALGRATPPASTLVLGRRPLSCAPYPMSIGTTTWGKDNWRFMPMTLAKPLTLAYLAVLCSAAPTGGTATLIFALYALNSSGQPTTRQADYSSYGSIDLTVGAGGESTLTTTGLIIPAGDWAIGCGWSGTASTSATMFSTSGTHPGVASNGIAQQASAWQQSVSGASAPSTASVAGGAVAGIAVYGVMG
jgi:hypothetical protein